MKISSRQQLTHPPLICTYDSSFTQNLDIGFFEITQIIICQTRAACKYIEQRQFIKLNFRLLTILLLTFIYIEMSSLLNQILAYYQ